MTSIQGGAPSSRSTSQVLLRIAYYVLACLLTASINRGALPAAQLYRPGAGGAAVPGAGCDQRPLCGAWGRALPRLCWLFFRSTTSSSSRTTRSSSTRRRICWGWCLFLGIAVGINQLLGWTRRNLAIAEVRQHEAMRLYELSSLLSGVQDEEAIGHLLATQIQEAFQAQRVEMLVEPRIGSKLVEFAVGSPPAGDALPDNTLLIPLQSARNLLGEIRALAEHPGHQPRRRTPAARLRRAGRAGIGKGQAGTSRHADQAAGRKRPAEDRHPVVSIARAALTAGSHQGGGHQPAQRRCGVGFGSHGGAAGGHRRRYRPAQPAGRQPAGYVAPGGGSVAATAPLECAAGDHPRGD